MTVCILPVLLQPQTIWMHVCQSYAKRSVKPFARERTGELLRGFERGRVGQDNVSGFAWLIP